MQITVVIPTMNRPELLSQCLKALCKQSVGKNNFEVLVVSDGPDDKSNLIVKSYQQKLNIRCFALSLKKAQQLRGTWGGGWQARR